MYSDRNNGVYVCKRNRYPSADVSHSGPDGATKHTDIRMSCLREYAKPNFPNKDEIYPDIGNSERSLRRLVG